MSLHGYIVNSIVTAAGHPLGQAFAIALGGALLEDITTATVGVLAASHKVSLTLAVFSLMCGIVVGDITLYTLGRLARTHRSLRRLVDHDRIAPVRSWIHEHSFGSIFITRFLPGFRATIYIAYGFFGITFWRFIIPSFLALIVWTSLLFVMGYALGSELFSWLGLWRWPIVIGALLLFFLAGHFHFKKIFSKQGSN